VPAGGREGEVHGRERLARAREEVLATAVIRTRRVVRSKSWTPTVVSSCATPALSDCCTTLTLAAARVKLSSSASATK
jgi:hypothetical protein